MALIVLGMAASAADSADLKNYAKAKLQEFSIDLPEQMWDGGMEPGTPNPAYDKLDELFKCDSDGKPLPVDPAIADKAIAEFCAGPAPVFERDYSMGMANGCFNMYRAIYRATRYNREQIEREDDDGAFRRMQQNFIIGRWMLEHDDLLGFAMGRSIVAHTLKAVAPRIKDFSAEQLASIRDDLSGIAAAISTQAKRTLAAEIAEVVVTASYYEQLKLSGETTILKRKFGDYSHWEELFEKAVKGGIELMRIYEMPVPERIAALRRFDRTFYRTTGGKDDKKLLMDSHLIYNFTRFEDTIGFYRTAIEMEITRRKSGAFPNPVPGIDPYTGKPFEFKNGVLSGAGTDLTHQPLLLKL